jgi:hypothetical protein
LRKILVAALAAVMVVAGATAALAQSGTAPSLTVTVKPKKAGTKKHPKNSSIHLLVVNNDTKRTLSKITITMPKTLKISGKGFKTCSKATLDDTNKGPRACPKGSKVGRGSADALVGVTHPSPTPIHFVVTAYVGGKNKMNFYLHSTTPGLAVNVTAPGRVVGRKLIVTVPEAAQKPAPLTYAGLVRFETTLKGKAKRHLLIASTGCKGGKDKFTAALTFINNGASPAGTVTVPGAAPCKK